MTTVGTLINVHKVLVIPVVLGLMWSYGNWSTEAYVYLALHGTYSLLWLMKQSYYPDPRFAQELPVWIGLLVVFLPLAGYYLTPYWIPFVVLGGWVFGFFVRNMLRKDKNLARHAGFAEYKSRTGLLFPKLFQVARESASHAS